MLEARKQQLNAESAQAPGKVISDIRKQLGKDAQGKSDDDGDSELRACGQSLKFGDTVYFIANWICE